MRAQVSLEFVYAFGVAFIIAIVIGVAVREQLNSLYAQRANFELLELANDARREVLIANSAQDGYERRFVLAHNLSGVDYSVYLSNTTLVASSVDQEIVFRVPGVSGDFVKGPNLIRKSGGVVYLN